jgi:phosphate uptake regulator
MKRKVIQVADSTSLISLPMKWVKKYDIKKGDELEVEIQNNSLLISTDAIAKVDEVEVDITNLDRTSIMYVIRSFYRLGFDNVRLIFKNSKTIYKRKEIEVSVISVIHAEVNRLVGYEIMQERKDSCIIKDIQESSMKDFDNVLRRIFLLLNDVIEEFQNGVKDMDVEALKTIEIKHDTVTKFASYCLRLLNKMTNEGPGKTSNYYHIIEILDWFMDIYKYAARDIIKYNKKLDPQVIEIFLHVKEGMDIYYKLFYKFENQKLFEINDIRSKAEKKLKLLKCKNSEEIIIVSKVFTILENLLHLIEARVALEYS